MPDGTNFGIRRSDGKWYVGTVDRRPVFSEGLHAASFGTEAAAAVRMRGLTEGEQHGRAFGVVPIDQGRDVLEQLAEDEQARDAQGGIDA